MDTYIDHTNKILQLFIMALFVYQMLVICARVKETDFNPLRNVYFFENFETFDISNIIHYTLYTNDYVTKYFSPCSVYFCNSFLLKTGDRVVVTPMISYTILHQPSMLQFYS